MAIPVPSSACPHPAQYTTHTMHTLLTPTRHTLSHSLPSHYTHQRPHLHLLLPLPQRLQLTFNSGETDKRSGRGMCCIGIICRGVVRFLGLRRMRGPELGVAVAELRRGWRRLNKECICVWLLADDEVSGQWGLTNKFSRTNTARNRTRRTRNYSSAQRDWECVQKQHNKRLFIATLVFSLSAFFFAS